MNKKRMKLFLAGVMLFVAAPAHAAETESLSGVYARALEYDASLRAARESYLGQKEEIDKAKSSFLPSLRVGAAYGRNATNSKSLVTDQEHDYYYNTQNYSIVLKQSVFNMSSFDTYGQSKARAAKGKALLAKEESALAMRTVEAYVNVLFAEDSIDYSKAQVTAAKEQFEQAKSRFSSGYGTVTEINEAKAHYDMALAQELTNRNNLENNRRQLETITGIYPDQLARLVPAKLVLSMPSPATLDAWLQYAEEQNADIEAARQDARIAKKQIDRQRSARYPTLDLVASRTFSESDNNYSIGNQYDTYAVSLQMNLPLYTGGYVSSTVRQASAQYREASELLNKQERITSSNIRKYFNGILSGIAQVRAYEQAVRSSEIALTGTQKGYAAGLRSNVDVLNAQEKLYESRRELSRSRYQYIMNRIMLKDAAGMLTSSDIDEVNSWLEK